MKGGARIPHASLKGLCKFTYVTDTEIDNK